MRIAIVVGTRPEAIKLAPINGLLRDEAYVIHTGQHYTSGMAGTNLEPDLVFDTCPGLDRGQQLGAWISALTPVLRNLRPDVVMVHGDTTSALAANASGTPVVHVEAGLRSYDRAMPEEHNRVLIDHLADLCCAPTDLARNNLLAENVPAGRIVITGNTIVEAVTAALPDRGTQTSILAELGLGGDTFVLATIHRPENTDRPEVLKTIFDELAMLPVPVVLPLHPRTQSSLVASGLDQRATAIRVTGPLDYPALLTLLRAAAVVITDSGGIQEEATVVKRPVLVVRRSNERPEVEAVFGRRVHAGPSISRTISAWLSRISSIHRRLQDAPSPFGDGTAAERVVRATRDLAACWTSTR
ncbi:non-hydrolyzing UDP-N-acetylglucosamine 2-epimerase [Saccharopolyspora thermophila]|uniref:UDP-N-acetylglucosamine 2-epimerase (Non-hydrolyzing) n=1 Tax=Saccharopolyspora thermophila TaxID=89367 RepID=A0ABP3N478_9PSEU